MTGFPPRGLIEGEGTDINFLNWTFPLFRIFGIPVRCHWFYPVLVVMYILRGPIEGRGDVGMMTAWLALIMAGLFVTTLIHELGHCFMARAVGGHADQILLWPLGGLSFVGHGGAPRDDIKIAAAGPLAQLPLATAAIGILLALGNPWHWDYINIFGDWYPFYPPREFFWHNFLLGFFKLQLVLILINLVVPAYPLDGGRILTNFLLMRYGRDRAAILITYFSIPVGLAITIWGFLQRELLIGFMGVWILFEAWQIRRLAQMGEIEAHPMFGQGAPQFDYMPDRPRPRPRPGFFARWRQRRAEKRALREARESQRAREKVDAVLEKVSREGLGSLTADERKVLDDASRRPPD